MFNNSDLAKLILRISVGGLMLFHGVGKIVHGIGGVKHLFVSAGLPEFFAYGIYLGEIVAPLMVLFGYYARLGALLIAFTMANALYLAHAQVLFTLNRHGAPQIELPLLYLLLSVAIFLFGPGKYSINRR